MTVNLDHPTLVWFAQVFGLFYLIALALGVVIYAYSPANRQRFERAAKTILHDEDRPCR